MSATNPNQKDRFDLIEGGKTKLIHEFNELTDECRTLLLKLIVYIRDNSPNARPMKKIIDIHTRRPLLDNRKQWTQFLRKLSEQRSSPLQQLRHLLSFATNDRIKRMTSNPAYPDSGIEPKLAELRNILIGIEHMSWKDKTEAIITLNEILIKSERIKFY